MLELVHLCFSFITINQFGLTNLFCAYVSHCKRTPANEGEANSSSALAALTATPTDLAASVRALSEVVVDTATAKKERKRLRNMKYSAKKREARTGRTTTTVPGLTNQAHDNQAVNNANNQAHDNQAVNEANNGADNRADDNEADDRAAMIEAAKRILGDCLSPSPKKRPRQACCHMLL